MTVSRALSNHPNVQKETRESVLKHARDMGYVKSAAAMAMRGDGTQIVGLLLPNIVNEFYARFANAMALACDQNAFQLIIHLTNDDKAVEELALDRLREVQAQAVVMVPSPGQSHVEPAHFDAMRVVQLIRQRTMTKDADAVLVDDGPALENAVRHLAKQGHSQIAYIGADAELSSGRSRLAAFEKGLEQVGLTKIPDLIRTGKPSFEMGRDQARDIIQNSPATALVCGGFEISNGALNAYMGSDQARSDQLAFVGYGDPSHYVWINGGISTVQIPVDALAQQAVDLIALKGADHPAQVFSFKAELIIRGTATG
ncbi:LacI family DNA-binding transcriptional regulator [Aestuariibius sp. HNIBRBA575]|uniref:LacI family DNA-binding transcriptional regulator n=1 Tax=Aestuariibius sp. HNIBRBA575 TaxID=3233343 RepID=UPI0034A31E0B